MKFTITSTWLIRLIALWAVVLAMLAFSYLLVLSNSVDLVSDAYGTQSRVWLIFGLNLLFGIGFAASSYGLWTQKNWGRLVFLWTICLWSAFSLFALFLPGLLLGAEQGHSPGALAINGLRYAITLALPLWYLNLPRIKAGFSGGISDNSFSGSDNV